MFTSVNTVVNSIALGPADDRFQHRETNRQSLQALIDNLLFVSDDDPLVTWIEENGIKSAEDFRALTREAILTWGTNNGEV